jgi:hypothetical protein
MCCFCLKRLDYIDPMDHEGKDNDGDILEDYALQQT